MTTEATKTKIDITHDVTKPENISSKIFDAAYSNEPYSCRVFVINPGSTSTKFAIYHDSNIVWRGIVHHTAEDLKDFHHPIEQLAYRTAAMHQMLRMFDVEMRFDAVIARGGLLHPTPAGVYEVTERIKHDLNTAKMEHVCNLGAAMAESLADAVGCKAYIADPEVADDFIPEARLSGIPEIERKSIFHALNSRAVARRYAKSIDRKYEDLNLIVVHLGGGISVGAHRHGKVIDVNNALNGDGPFTPERAGTVPAHQLVELCFSGKYTEEEIKKLLCGRGGLMAHLGTNNTAEIAARAEAGEEPYKSVLDAMLYSVSKEVGSRFVALKGKCDAIIITGGIAHNEYCVDQIKDWVGYMAPIYVRPGEDELGALAENAVGAVTGTITPLEYNPAY